MRKSLLLSAFANIIGIVCYGQDSVLSRLPEQYLSKISSRMEVINGRLDRRSQKAMDAFEKQEDKIRKKLSRIDSSKSKELLTSAGESYQNLMHKLQHLENFKRYIPYLDTLKSSIKFLTQNKEFVSRAGELNGAFVKVNDLEASFARAEGILQFIRERKQYLKELIGSYGFNRELKRLNNEAYYYAAQVNEYKEVLKDSKKLERKAIETLSKTKAFRDFMSKNSELASLFRLPQTDDVSSSASLQGLQTRASITQLIQERFGTGTGVQSLLQQNVQSAQGQLAALKDRMNILGGNAEDASLPDFKPNSQKTKSFGKRLEYGTNVQTQKSSRYFPVTSDLGLSLGYKLNDKSIVGIGASYKLGCGSGWNNIRITHQGLGLRTFMNYKLKGSLFISGGYEQNYRTEIRNIDQLKNYSAWQASGLAGLSKHYSISKKFKGNMQLLWDFLSYRQLPKTQPLIFRIGYSFK